MTIIKYKDKKYDFSWQSGILFFIFCPLIALIIYIIFESFWVYTHPPFIYPVIGLLNLLTDQEFSFYQSTSMYLFNVPGQSVIGFISDCAGIHGYIIYAGICIMAPHNKFKEENNNIWKRKFLTFLIPSLIFLVENVLRTTLTLFFYYNGVPFHPMHEYISYFTTFFAIFIFYSISYYLLPEFMLFIFWIGKSIKERILKISIDEKHSSLELQDRDEAKKSIIITMGIAISILLVIIFSIIIVQ